MLPLTKLTFNSCAEDLNDSTTKEILMLLLAF